jgi:hypothetical protein
MDLDPLHVATDDGPREGDAVRAREGVLDDAVEVAEEPELRPPDPEEARLRLGASPTETPPVRRSASAVSSARRSGPISFSSQRATLGSGASRFFRSFSGASSACVYRPTSDPSPQKELDS